MNRHADTPTGRRAAVVVLVVHGTRDPAGQAAAHGLADRVRARGVPVRLAFADVCAPDVATVLAGLRGHPAVVVPAFLAAGYHVREDIPAQVAASGHPAVRVAACLGAAPELVGAAHARLTEAGYRAEDTVVLAAAGSRDRSALDQVDAVAGALSRRLRAPVHIGYAASARPSVEQAVAAVSGPVAVASWLLAPGLFHRRARAAGARRVAEPLVGDDRVVDLVLRRYAECLVSRVPPR